MIGAHLLGRYVIILTLLCRTAFCQEQPSDGAAREAQLKDWLPAKVNLLKELLEETPRTDRSGVADPNNGWTIRAKRSALSWIVKTIDRRWLPADPNVLRQSIIMIQNAFGPNDVTYSQWEANAHIVQVAQMQTILLICVRPVSPTHVGNELTKEAMIAWARDVVSTVLRREIDFLVYGPNMRKWTKKVITSEVLAGSFEHAEVQACTDAVHGKCAPPEVLEEKAHHYRYWWRCINWWTDGTKIGLYMLKAEGGPWIPNYRSGLDATWFEGPPHKGKRQR